MNYYITDIYISNKCYTKFSINALQENVIAITAKLSGV